MAKPTRPIRLVWVVPELGGGIQTYSKALWPSVRESCARNGIECGEPLFFGPKDLPRIPGELKKTGPTLIHVQHEYGLFGRKLPVCYQFPSWLRSLRAELPEVRIVATAHTVLSRKYRYPLGGRGWQVPWRMVANQLVVPVLSHLWNERTWGILDGVVVHSRSQVPLVRESGCALVRDIPHFVPKLPFGAQAKSVTRNAHPALQQLPAEIPAILVFGYLSPEKGQDTAIRALAGMREKAVLILAGGVRRKDDEPFSVRCWELARQLGVEDRVVITGFVPEDLISEFYSRAALVLAPFRETSGSGSLAQAFARRAPILASDLPLNRELNDRIPGALELFRAEDARDCAQKLDQLIAAPAGKAGPAGDTAIERLRIGARLYAEAFSVENMAAKHVEFYFELFGKSRGETRNAK